MIAASPQDGFERYQRICSALGITDYSPRIIHYTSIEGLRGMLGSRELWFGRLPELDDTTECNHFLDAVIAGVSELVLGGGGGVDLTARLEPFRDALRSGSFVSSWCEYPESETDGRLSMWSLYGDSCEGVGLVVDSTGFQPSVSSPAKIRFHVQVAKVEYVKADHAVSLANDYLRRLNSVEFMQAALHDKLGLALMLATKAPCVKHDGFKEQQEVRFMHMRGFTDRMRALGIPIPPYPSGHVHSCGARTFFALPLQNYPEYSLDLRLERILKRVVIGPGRNRIARAKVVRDLLNANGLAAVEIYQSDIPLAA